MPLRLRPGFGYADPLGRFGNMQEEIDRAFGRRRRRGSTSEFPPLNVWSGEHDVVVTAEVPGVDANDIDLDVDGPVLTIKGRRAAPALDEKAAAHRRERAYGSFARSVTLSYDVDTEKVQAECRDGILRVYLPRPESEKPRRIPIAKG